MAAGERGGVQAVRPTAPEGGPAAIQAVPVRHYGRWVGATIVLLLVVWLVSTAAGSENIRWSEVPDYLFNRRILEGLVNTIVVSVLAMAIGIVLGIVFAVMRLSGNPVLSGVSWFYIWLFRGTPVLLQLLLWYNLGLVFSSVTIAVPFTDLTLYSKPINDFMTPLMAALLGLGLNEGAYMAEIVRGGIQSIDEGQTEAAHALGMTPSRTMRRIILPQAMRVIIPPTGNEFISMLKLSSLASLVQYGEILRRAEDIYTRNLLVLELLFTLSIWYLVVTTVFSTGQFFVERRFARGTRRGQMLHPVERLWFWLRSRLRPELAGRYGR
jgi:polar amino acid transport system permease protein